MEHYNRKYSKAEGSMKLEHEAGKEVYIDFAGKKLHITNRETGELVQVEVFIAILPNSQYTYVEACVSQKREDLVTCMAGALSFFGGVPKAIVSDNLKSAVTRASKYEPGHQPHVQRLCPPLWLCYQPHAAIRRRTKLWSKMPSTSLISVFTIPCGT